MRRGKASEASPKGVQPNPACCRELHELVEALTRAKADGRKCSLLIGAGCSVTAGIHGSPKLIDDIKKKHKAAYARAQKEYGSANPTYGQCMSKLTEDQRKALITKCVNRAKVNWAHIAIATLLDSGYVDSVLTTNFDNLLVKACSMANLFPGIYDMTLYRPAGSSKDAAFDWDDLPKQSLIYLHGQSTGFRLLNTEQDLKKHAPRIGDCFRFDKGKRLWIVVGYSGESDPIFSKHIATRNRFSDGLYWVGYEDVGVASKVNDALFCGNKDAFYMSGFSADQFFLKLTQALKIFPPAFVADPVGHLKRNLEQITDFPLTGTEDLKKAFEQQIAVLRKAQVLTKKEQTPTQSLILLYMEGKYDDVLSAFESLGQEDKNKHALIASGAAFELAINETHDLESSSREGHMKRLARKCDLYQYATELRPNFHVAYFNWGIALCDRAMQTSGEESVQLLREAEDKYRLATSIRPDYHLAFYNWGYTLCMHAEQATGIEATRLYLEAEKKFCRAIELKQDDQKALNNWGLALASRATRSSGKEAIRLFNEAVHKYQAALDIEPDSHETLTNWGSALAQRAELTYGKEAIKLLREAEDKYARAIEISSNLHDVFYGWGNVLAMRAELAIDDEAVLLFKEAERKYRHAIDLKPDYTEALLNLGITILERSYFEIADIKQNTIHGAIEVLTRVERIRAGAASDSVAWAYALLGNEDECLKWLECARSHGTLRAKQFILDAPDFEAVREKEWFKEFIRRAYPETEGRD